MYSNSLREYRDKEISPFYKAKLMPIMYMFSGETMIRFQYRRLRAPFFTQFILNLPGNLGNQWASQVVLVVKNPPANAEDARVASSTPRTGKLPWKRAEQSTPVFLPGESYGQRSSAGYSS